MAITHAICTLMRNAQSVQDYFTSRAATVATRIVDFRTSVAQWPNVAYQRLGTTRDYTDSGVIDLKTTTIQVTVYALDDAEARELADLLTPVFEDFTGTLAGHRIDRIRIDDDTDLSGGSLEGETDFVPAVALTLSVFHT